MVAPASASLGTIGSLLEKLDVLLAASKDDPGSTIRLPKGLKDGVVHHLKVDLEEISSYLQDLSEVEDPPRTAKCWMKEARELSYDIEDYIDSFARPGRSVSVKNRFVCKISHVKIARLSKNNKKLKRRKGMVDMFSEFRIRAHEAIERHKRYDLDLTTFRRRYAPVGPMLPTPYEEGADLVIDGRTSEFVNSLVNDGDEQFKVVSIVGSGGIGKTTLARVLYNKLSGKFDYGIFLRMSRNPDIKTVLRGVLTKIHRQQADGDCEDLDLIGEIRKLLQNRRYLVIIDDLWAASSWDIISNAFPEGNKRSRIIITTEIQDVALSCCCYGSEYVFEMKPLHHDYSRKLFFNRFFCSESDFPQKCKEVLNKIVEICGGLPLSTISMASLLATHPVILVEQWTYICDSLRCLLRKSSTSDGTRLILNLSYNYMAHHLKTCLLYLNMYPEGSIVCKDDLVNQWSAEGFIEATEGQDVKKVAENYFHELIDRRFLQPACIKNNDEVVSCTVNDVVRDLVALKSTEENFIMVADYSRKNVELSDKVHRLSLQFLDAKYAKTPANIGTSQVRSLSFFGLSKCMPSITEFKLLRVLNLQLWGHHGDDILDLTGISELFQLRYLKVASDGCIELPNHMGGLLYLETVDIDTKVIGVPWDIIHLPCLLYLHLPFDTNLMVRTLSMSSDSSTSLGKLTNLEDLRLTYSTPLSDDLERNMEALWSILGRLGSLKTLALVPSSSHKKALVCGPSEVIDSSDSFTPPLLLQRFDWMPCSCTFSKLPKWMKMLGNLCVLKIAVRDLVKDGVDILRDLPCLTALSLYVMTVPVEMVVFDKAGFSVLKYFKLRCSALPWLKFEANAMLNLRKLNLGFNAHIVNRYGCTPISIEHLPGLQEISVKIGATSDDAEPSLTAAISNHPSNPSLNIHLVDRILCFPQARSTLAKDKVHESLKEDTTEVRRMSTKWKEHQTKEEDSTEARIVFTEGKEHKNLQEEETTEVKSVSTKGKEHETLQQEDSVTVRIVSTQGKEHGSQQEQDSTEVRTVMTKGKEHETLQEDSTEVINVSTKAKEHKTPQEEDSTKVTIVLSKGREHETLQEENPTKIRNVSTKGKVHETPEEDDDSTVEEEVNESAFMAARNRMHRLLEEKNGFLEEGPDRYHVNAEEGSKETEQTNIRISMPWASYSNLPLPGGHRRPSNSPIRAGAGGSSIHPVVPSYDFRPDKRGREDPERIVRQLLTKCVEALAEERIDGFHKLVQEARGVVAITGEPIERIGADLLEGLVARHENSGTSIYRALKSRAMSRELGSDKLSYMTILYDICLYFKFAYMAANWAIVEAFRNEDKIHIIDFQIAEGMQWKTLLHAFSARPGCPPHVRITGIDDPVSEYGCGEGLEIVGKRLKMLCEELRIPLEFNALPVYATQVTKEMLQIRPGEALAVNFTFQLHRIPDESVDFNNPRDGLLRMVKELSPKVITLVEQELDTNTTPFFLRFMETMDYYSAVFESIDANLPRDSKERINVEQQCLAKDIVNIIACEGKDRVERYEPLSKWRWRLTMAGFRPYPLNVDVNSTIKRLLGSYSDKYTLEEKDGAMLIGWKNRKLVSTSAWQLIQTEHGTMPRSPSRGSSSRNADQG